MISAKQYFLFILLSATPAFCSAQYFQQEVNYTIHVTLDDSKNMLRAFENISYKNNSGQSLTKLYIHLWPEAYKDQNTSLAKELFKNGNSQIISASENDLGYIDSLDFYIDDKKANWKILQDTSDICCIYLTTPLQHGDSIQITTPFRLKIPSAYISRLGHKDQSYYISQWFPKPAVFDQNGWNYFSYQNQGEFYGEFGSFDVFVTLPENYVIAATGMMKNSDSEINWLMKKDSTTRATKEFSGKPTTILSSSIKKTVHFYQNKIHDFAWFADKRWNVLIDTTTLPNSKKTIQLYSYFYNEDAENWKRSTDFMRDAIHYYSKWIGEYPYDQLSMVDVGNARGSDMEYPTIATIGNYGDSFELETTIVHETGHNWFYSALGNNERKYAWMDEGINSFYVSRYVYTKFSGDSSKQNKNITLSYFGNRQTKINFRLKQYYRYLAGARQNSDQSPSTSSELMNRSNYSGEVYNKSSLSFEYLKAYLGDSLIDSCMRKYFNDWKFRHPQPADLKYSFESTSGKNLNWMFDDLLAGTKKLDYKIVSCQNNKNGTEVITLVNNGSIAGPVNVDCIGGDEIKYSQWTEGFFGKKELIFNNQNCDYYRIDSQRRIPELYRNNNTIRATGPFKKTEKIQISLGNGIEDPNFSQLFFSPAIGWNKYNSIMAGGVFHNISFLEKKLEFIIMPLYSFGTKDLVGGGQINYHLYPNSRINRITLQSGISRYAFANDTYTFPLNNSLYQNTLHFIKSDTKIVLNILPSDRTIKLTNRITIRNIFVNRGIPYSINYRKENKNINYLQAEYIRENKNPLDLFLQRLIVTTGDRFIYAAAEACNFFTYRNSNKGFSTRLFGGFTSIPSTSTYGIDYKMSLSGRTGLQDYLFDEVFLGRSESDGILSQQFVNDFGGFISRTSYFHESNKWMAGINMNTTLPGLLPFRLFANIGSFDNAGIGDQFGKISWELGVDLPVIKDIFVIYLPFAYSKDIKYAIDKLKLNTGELIRFELHLKKLNPLTILKSTAQ